MKDSRYKSKDDFIKEQVRDTEDLVKRGVIDADKLNSERIFTLVTRDYRNRPHIIKDDVLTWLKNNRPDIQ